MWSSKVVCKEILISFVENAELGDVVDVDDVDVDVDVDDDDVDFASTWCEEETFQI